MAKPLFESRSNSLYTIFGSAINVTSLLLFAAASPIPEWMKSLVSNLIALCCEVTQLKIGYSCVLMPPTADTPP